jgi:hypothetical protein
LYPTEFLNSLNGYGLMGNMMMMMKQFEFLGSAPSQVVVAGGVPHNFAEELEWRAC